VFRIKQYKCFSNIGSIQCYGINDFLGKLFIYFFIFFKKLYNLYTIYIISKYDDVNITGHENLEGRECPMTLLPI